MKKIINKLRSIFRRLLGVPALSRELKDNVVFKSDFPDGKLDGQPYQIGRFSLVDYGGNVKFGKNVKVGYGVIILSVSTITGKGEIDTVRKPVIIEDNVEIGSNSVILPGVTIGANSTIGAGAVVNKDIPPNSVAVGVPAKVIKKKD